MLLFPLQCPSVSTVFAFSLICITVLDTCSAFSVLPGSTSTVTKNPSTYSLYALGEKVIQSEDISIETYSHKDGWNNLTYRYKPAAAGFEENPPIVFIHPVGIGCSSWFWTRLMDQWKEGPAMYAVDLLGCGVESGADEWIPEEKGLFFPLSWAEGCESLINTVVLPRFKSNQSAFSWNKLNTGCVVVSQGGLAPVGVVLASRNPESVVSKLVLTSPPTWEDMIKPIPTAELEKNFKFLSSPFWGNLAFSILETRNAVRFFSDLFLFAESCDEEWLDYSDNAMIKSARPPVQAFNAGMCNHRSFEEEMTELINQPTIIVSGQDDKRKEMREMYGTQMKNCQLKTVKGLNVLPWESTKEFQQVLEEFLKM